MAAESVSADEDTGEGPRYILPPPATTYGKQPGEPLTPVETMVWQKITSLLGDSCVLDGSLVRAARKHAVDLTENPSMSQENGIDYLRFALRYFGSPDYLVSPAVFELDGHGDDSLAEVVGRARVDWTHCGIGVHVSGGRQQAVFIAATRVLSLKPIPVQPQPGRTIDVRGTIASPDGSDVDAFLEAPDGSVQQLKTFVVGARQFQISVPVKDVGTYKLELQVTRQSGPETALLVPLYVGVDVELRPHVFPAAAAADGDPKAVMTGLLNRIRQNLGLPPLQRDKRLDSVAQQHCEDMVRTATFGHFSKRSGTLSDRLQAHRLYPRLSAENIGRSSTMMRVHHNLMQSPSHKIKVLTPEFTHLGLGIVIRDGSTSVTQVFTAW